MTPQSAGPGFGPWAGQYDRYFVAVRLEFNLSLRIMMRWCWSPPGVTIAGL